MTIGSTVHSYLQLARISNAPTVVSNALTGCALGAVALGTRSFPWLTAGAVALAAVLLYVAGMALNDLADVRVDRIERPNRPLASGAVSMGAAILFVLVCVAVAMAVLGVIGQRALMLGAALLAIIVAYDFLHRYSAITVVLLGACRALVYILAAAAVAWPIDWRWAGPMAGGLALYTIAISVIARGEADDPAKMRGRVRLVVGMICGISVLDTVFLVILLQPQPAAAALLCLGAALWGQRRILGS